MIRNFFLLFLSSFLSSFLEASETQQNFLYTRPFLISSKEYCLNANDFEGCMKYIEKKDSTLIKENNSINCTIKICSPDEAIIYGTDNLGLKTLRGYSFYDNPSRRSAYYYSNTLKLNINGSYGRYLHRQYIVRYYSEGYPGSLITIPNYNSGSFPSINYSSGKAPGVRQVVMDYVFDCDKKVFTSFYNNKQKRYKTKSGKKRKWVNFEEVNGEFEKEGVKDCQLSRIDIMSLNKSYFQGFKPKKVNKSSNKINLGINCNSPVWRDRPRCS